MALLTARCSRSGALRPSRHLPVATFPIATPPRSRCCSHSAPPPPSPTPLKMSTAPAPAAEGPPPPVSLILQRLTAFASSNRAGTVPSRRASASSAARPSSPPLSPLTRPSSPSSLSTARRAAVLLGLFAHPVTSEVNVLLTLRSSSLTAHSGEVSLPGGKADEADGGDDVATALREAEEEIGLQRSHPALRVLGRMNRVLSKAHLLVTPVVALIPVPDFVLRNAQRSAHAANGSGSTSPSASASSTSPPASFVPFLNPAEVSVLFAVPLSTFLSSSGYRSEDRAYQSYSYRLHYFHRSTTDWVEVDAAAPVSAGQPQAAGNGEERGWLVWGMTAHILIAAARVAYDRQPQFPLLPYTHSDATLPSRAPPPPSPSPSSSAAPISTGEPPPASTSTEVGPSQSSL